MPHEDWERRNRRREFGLAAARIMKLAERAEREDRIGGVPIVADASLPESGSWSLVLHSYEPPESLAFVDDDGEP